jgi:hypothetical protein
MSRALGLGGLMCLLALPVAAGPDSGRISGVVLDSTGTPQMGATVIVSAERLANGPPVELLTNDRGRFFTAALPAGIYSIKVTLAGFLPVMEQHIQVNNQHTTLLEIVLGSVFSSFEKLRRQPDQQPAADDWTWVLRTSAATRSVLRWQDGEVVVDGQPTETESAERQAIRGRLDLTSGADHPGSIANLADSPATAFVYDVDVGSQGHLLMAGQFSYEGTSPAGGLAAEWLPHGEGGVGPVTSLVVRESRLGPDGPTFRGLRLSHDDQFALSERISVRYGAEYISAGFNGTTSALRPHGEVVVQLAPSWQASATVAARPWQDGLGLEGALETALDTLDAFPTLMMRDGRPILENGLHEEGAVKYSWGKKADLSAAVFHDRSSHTAVIGRGAASGPDFLQDYFSDAFAYDGGNSSSTGARFAYRQKLNDRISTTVVYAYGGALAPVSDSVVEHLLREKLSTQDRHSLAARFSTTVPRLKTKLTAGYKWIDGPAVSQQDAYGESLYHLDPYLSLEVRQPLPAIFQCHMEILADAGNLLAQGYVPMVTSDGRVVLVPSYRYFRGGLSFQF